MKCLCCVSNIRLFQKCQVGHLTKLANIVVTRINTILKIINFYMNKIYHIEEYIKICTKKRQNNTLMHCNKLSLFLSSMYTYIHNQECSLHGLILLCEHWNYSLIYFESCKLFFKFYICFFYSFALYDLNPTVRSIWSLQVFASLIDFQQKYCILLFEHMLLKGS